uniref:Uncharacterized protein n=1 Tax=Catharus ustulatus TaxID=91951 RepID=A0A8C3UTJ7_CATUS
MMRSQCLLGLRSFVAFAAKLWSFVLYLLRRQARTVIQYQTVRYDVLPLSPISRNRLSESGTKKNKFGGKKIKFLGKKNKFGRKKNKVGRKNPKIWGEKMKLGVKNQS